METLDVYDGSAGFLRDLQLGGDELTKVSVSELIMRTFLDPIGFELTLVPSPFS